MKIKTGDPAVTLINNLVINIYDIPTVMNIFLKINLAYSLMNIFGG